MTFSNAVELWEYQHPENKFMDAFVLNAFMDKNELLDYLLYDYGNLLTVEIHSDSFHDMVDNFFRVHKWNIDKLADSMNFLYNPIDNTDWKQVQDYDRGQDFGSVTDRDLATDRDVDSDKDVSTDTGSTTDRDINTTRTEGIDSTTTWTENENSHETDMHNVSAFNDGNRNTPKSVDNIDKIYSKQGHDTTNTDEDERTITTDDTIYKQDVKTKEGATTAEDIKTEEDITKNEKTKEQIDLIITRKGHDGNVSYQSLIEEERKQAQFNLFKWIGNHFASELLICVW